MLLAIIAFIFAVIFSTLDYFLSIKRAGKLPTGAIVRLTFFMLVMVTGITDIISKGVADEAEKEKTLNKIDSSMMQIDRRIDSLMSVKPDTTR